MRPETLSSIAIDYQDPCIYPRRLTAGTQLNRHLTLDAPLLSAQLQQPLS